MKKFSFILVFFILKINLFAEVDAYEQRIVELTKNRNYKELYKIMDKEVNHLKDYKHSSIWAQMYEGGFGVQQNSKKAIEFHEKAVNWYKKASSSYRLGQYYFYGKNVDKKDYKKAADWWRIGATLGSKKSMYSYASILLQNKLDDNFFNYLVASKWVQFAAKKGDAEAKDFLQKNPDLKDLEIYLNLRKYNIARTPYERKLAGVVLGEKFNEELLIPYKKYKRKPFIQANVTSINYYKNLPNIYANKNNKYFKNLKYLYAKSTLHSDTVYRVEGYYFFKTKVDSKRFQKYYFEKLLYNSSVSPSNLKTIKLKYLVTYVDIGITGNISKKSWPYGVKSTKNLKGIRHLVEIYPSKKANGYYVKVTVIDFAALKLKIAEAIQYDSFFNYVGKNNINSHSYMNHFGLTLLQKIPSSISKHEISSSSRVNKYSFTPMYAHKFFQNYTVSTSLLTNTILDIKAQGEFSNGMDVHNAEKGIKKGIFYKYNLNDVCWSFDDFIISSRDGRNCLSEDLGEDETNILIDYKRNNNNNYILYFKAYSKFAKKIKDREYWLLNY